MTANVEESGQPWLTPSCIGMVVHSPLSSLIVII